jgi:hypothetical protein
MHLTEYAVQGLMADSYEHCNEPPGSKKGRKFLDQLNDYHPLKMDSAPWSFGFLPHSFRLLVARPESFSPINHLKPKLV